MISPISFGLLLTAVAALAQVGGLPPSFEVASVKTSAPIVSKEGKDRIGMTVSGARVEMNYATLAELVRIAYRVRLDQVTVPDRAASEHFDVAAKMADGASQDRMPEMLQVLLAERFKLALHREQKERGIYALLVGKSGVKLPEVEAVPDPKSPNWVKAADAMRLNQKMTIAALANYLGRFAERPVVDFTELKGTYQIDMEIPVEDMIRAKNAVEGAMRPGSSASDPVDSPILGGVQKLGLRLESRKVATEILVVDHTEKIPSEN